MPIGAGKLKQLIVGLLAATLVAALPAWAEPRLQLLSSYDWERGEPWFGGFSALEVDAGGDSATLLTDRGSVVRVRIKRSAEKLVGIDVLSRVVLRDAEGRPLRGSFRDAEGLAVDPDGNSFVSFEFRNRVMRLEPASGRLFSLPNHTDFAGFIDNEGLEALAIDRDGRLFTLRENAAGQDGTIPIYNYRQGRWRISHRVPLTRPFVPVGADFDAAGRLYLLERALTPLGFRSRIRRLDLDSGPVVTLLSTLPGLYDNLEGISVWTDAAGRTRVNAISDDNFLTLQRTQLVEFILTE